MIEQRDQQATEWLQLNAAARLAGVSRTSLHRAAAAGELPFATIVGERFFTADDIAQWVAARRTAATTAPRGYNASGRVAT
jgi:predicted DNA-binding transcriptional regulator AlpA